METSLQDRTFRTRNTEKCFRFKPEAIENHAPPHKGIYELVTFDENQKPQVLYIGAAFEKTIKECLEGHETGTLLPSAEDLLQKHANLYFDYLEETGAKTVEDAQDVYWWLIQKFKPPYNNISSITPSGRPGKINVIELD